MTQTHTTRTGLIAAMLIAGAGSGMALLGGCTRFHESQSVVVQRDGGEVPVEGAGVSSVMDWSQLGIDIDNQRGTVTVEVSPEVQSPAVWAGVVSEPDEKGFVKGAGARQVDFVSATVAMPEGRPILRVVAASPGEAEAKFVNLRIVVPACAGMRLRNSGGKVYAKGVGGSLDVVNSTRGVWGGTTIVAAGIIIDRVTIKAAQGGIDFRMPAGSTAALHARTEKGRLTMDLDAAKVVNAYHRGNEYSATVNGGTNRIELVAQQGDVTVMYDRK